MKIEYTGGMKHYRTDIFHERYVFNKENNYIVDVKDVRVIRELMITGLFLPVEEKKVVKPAPVKKVAQSVKKGG